MQIICEKYSILKCLHQTESNTVYLTEHMGLGTRRIIKKMKKENNFQLPEIDILKNLVHPNIPRIIDITEDEDFFFLIREYAKGSNLEEWMEEKDKWKDKELTEIALQLADVFCYLHKGLDRPIIYRDLKPENIILDKEGHLSLIDFGIARQVSPERMKDTCFLGTKAYAAPEQFGVFRSDEKSDIYAFGMTLYYLLGRHKLTEPPYRRLEMESWFKDYAYELVKLIYDCSEPQREKRPESFAEVKKRLQELTNEITFSDPIPQNANIYLGIRAGVGTSFITYAHAFAAMTKGKKVAILDWSESQQMEKLNYVVDTVEVKKYSFMIDGLEIYPLKREQDIRFDLQDYDEIFIDYGVLTGEKRKWIATHQSRVRLICSGASWDMVDLDEVIFNEKLIDYHFIINLTDDDVLDKLNEDYPETKFELFSYQKNLQNYAYQIMTDIEKASPNTLFQKIKNLSFKI